MLYFYENRHITIRDAIFFFMKELLIKILLIMAIVLVVMIVIYIGAKTYLLFKNKSQQPAAVSQQQSRSESIKSDPFSSLIIADTSKSVQTQFFKESALKALNVVKGTDAVSPQDIDGINFKGKEILDTLKFMNDDARSNIYIAIQYMLVSSPDGEESMRQLSYKEEIPMWMLMIREAMAKTIPNINFHSETPALSVSYSKTA